MLAALQPLRDAVKAGDRDGLLKMLKEGRDQTTLRGLSLYTIQVPPATTLVRIHNPKTFGDDVAPRRKMVVQAMTTAKAVGGIEPGLDNLTVFGTTPMVEDGKVIGTVDIGAPFGKSFVERMKARFGVDISILQLTGDKINVIASTLAKPADDIAMLRRAFAGDLVIEKGEAGGKAVASTFGPLKNFSGDPVAVLRDRARRQRLCGAGSEFDAVAGARHAVRRADRRRDRGVARPRHGEADPGAGKRDARDLERPAQCRGAGQWPQR